ncbi:hypothetical protein KKG41_05320 [Patescibacteria group bacterium]|nr:hypothetical protein [Patescibacteria group bacterium]MBU1890501.1 hypothetical protein [Patescibacteria group bacterium]
MTVTRRKKISQAKSKVVPIRVIKSNKRSAVITEEEEKPILSATTKAKRTKTSQPITISHANKRNYLWIGVSFSFIVVLLLWISLSHVLPKTSNKKSDDSLLSISDSISQIGNVLASHNVSFDSFLDQLNQQSEVQKAGELDRKVFPQFYE